MKTLATLCLFVIAAVSVQGQVISHQKISDTQGNFSGTLETDANRKFIGEVRKIERDAGQIKVTCFGELSKAILENDHGGGLEVVHKEAVQVATVAIKIAKMTKYQTGT